MTDADSRLPMEQETAVKDSDAPVGEQKRKVLGLADFRSLDLTDSSLIANNLARCQEGGFHHFEPARFRYIAVMARRASEKRQAGEKNGVIGRIEEKAARALAQYREDFFHARLLAEKAVADLSARHPGEIERLDSILRSHDPNTVIRQCARLNRPVKSNPLATLMEQLSDAEASTGHQSDLAFDLLDTHLPNLNTGESTAPIELKSVQLLRQSWHKRSLDNLVTRALQAKPENPGPLNPDMLVIRALSTMRDLSSDYLSRFVSYIDTLYWLEQETGGAESVKATGKSATPATARVVRKKRGRKQNSNKKQSENRKMGSKIRPE